MVMLTRVLVVLGICFGAVALALPTREPREVDSLEEGDGPTQELFEECTDPDRTGPVALPGRNSETGEWQCFDILTRGPCKSDNETDQWFVLNKELREGDYGTYGKCVNITCGDADTVVVYDGQGSGTNTSCEFIGRPSPLCSLNGAILVNPHGEGECSTCRSKRGQCGTRGPCEPGTQPDSTFATTNTATTTTTTITTPTTTTTTTPTTTAAPDPVLFGGATLTEVTRRRRDNEEDEVDDGAVAEACEELNIKHYQKGTRTWDICKKFALKMIREDAAQQSGEDHDDEDAAEEEEEQEEEAEDLQEEVQEKSREDDETESESEAGAVCVETGCPNSTQIKWYDEEHKDGVCVEEFVQDEANCNKDVKLKYGAESKLTCDSLSIGLRQVFVLPVTCDEGFSLNHEGECKKIYSFNNEEGRRRPPRAVATGNKNLRQFIRSRFSAKGKR